MSSRNSEPTIETTSNDEVGTDADEADEEVPPWPERGPEIAARTAATDRDVDDGDEDGWDEDDWDDDERGADTGARATVPQPDPEPIPLPGPDPAPDPIPQPEPDPAPPPGPDPRPGPVPPPPGPEPVPQPGPDPAPEPGPVPSPAPQATGTDEGSADLDAAPDLELAVHEEPEAEVATIDDDVDVELEVETADDDVDDFDGEDLDDADDQFLDDLDEDLDESDDPEVATAALAAVGGDDVVDRAFPEPPSAVDVEPIGPPLLTDAAGWEDRWTSVQAAFVDDPGLSIQHADRLVTEAMEEVARLLLARRESLQDRWRSGDPPPDTEQLRLTLQGYRGLLFGLLSAEPS